MAAQRAKELERASRLDPSILDPDELVAMMEFEDWTVRMHLCRMVPRVEWPEPVRPQVLAFAFKEAGSQNKFVRAWALDALSHLAVEDEAIQPEVLMMLQGAVESGLPSVKVRAGLGIQLLLGSH